MISRDWICSNGHEFHSYEKGNPECPVCGQVQVSWIPGGGHIGKVAPGADRTLRDLAASYGMTNINSPSPSRLNRAMPAAKQPSSGASLGMKQWAPGFATPVYDRPHCETSWYPPDIKGFQPVGRVLPQGGDMGYKGVTPVARHRPLAGR